MNRALFISVAIVFTVLGACSAATGIAVGMSNGGIMDNLAALIKFGIDHAGDIAQLVTQAGQLVGAAWVLLTALSAALKGKSAKAQRTHAKLVGMLKVS